MVEVLVVVRDVMELLVVRLVALVVALMLVVDVVFVMDDDVTVLVMTRS